MNLFSARRSLSAIRYAAYQQRSASSLARLVRLQRKFGRRGSALSFHFPLDDAVAARRFWLAVLCLVRASCGDNSSTSYSAVLKSNLVTRSTRSKPLTCSHLKIRRLPRGGATTVVTSSMGDNIWSSRCPPVRNASDGQFRSHAA